MPAHILTSFQLDLHFDAEGRPTSEIEVHGHLQAPTYTTSLNGVTVMPGASLGNLRHVTTLDGCVLCEGASLFNLCSLRTVGSAKIGAGCLLHGLPADVHLGTPKVSPAELEILQRIPLTNLSMQEWHGSCGTVHCLAGWAQVLCHGTTRTNGLSVGEVGAKLLPSLSYAFYAMQSTAEARAMIVRILEQNQSSPSPHPKQTHLSLVCDRCRYKWDSVAALDPAVQPADLICPECREGYGGIDRK